MSPRSHSDSPLAIYSLGQYDLALSAYLVEFRMKLPYLTNLVIVGSVAAMLSGCTSPQVRKEKIDSDIQQNWTPEMVGDLTREQAFTDCNAKSEEFDVRSQDPLNNWDAFMRTCMNAKGFNRTAAEP